MKRDKKKEKKTKKNYDENLSCVCFEVCMIMAVCENMYTYV